MAHIRDDNFKTIYIVREANSEEPLAVFRDLRDAYRFSTNRCMEICRAAYITVKEYYILEEELSKVIRTTIWYDSATGLNNSIARYTITDC